MAISASMSALTASISALIIGGESSSPAPSHVASSRKSSSPLLKEKEHQMDQPEHAQGSALLEEVITFCSVRSTMPALSSTARRTLRLPQTALGLRGHNPGSLSAAPRDRVRALTPLQALAAAPPSPRSCAEPRAGLSFWRTGLAGIICDDVECAEKGVHTSTIYQPVELAAEAREE